MIYLDNAATTPVDESVLNAMTPYFSESFGNPQSQHAAGRAAANAVISARDGMARELGCRADEIYFVSGGTEAGNTALKGVCAYHKKGRVVVSAIEHPALLSASEDMKAQGFEVTRIFPDENGVVSPESVLNSLTDDTIFCAVMAANNETGVIQPVEEIGRICRERGVFYYADCVQTACSQKVDVNFCDCLGISAHKFYGPKGIGALYIKNGSKISRLISGGMQERGFRGGTLNAAAVVGMAEAFKNACKDREKNNEYIKNLRDAFVKRVLTEIEGTHLNGGGEILPSHANISFDGCDGENILFLLDIAGVCVSTGSACSAGAVNPSHVLTAMGLGNGRAKSAVRFTFGKYNTTDEVNETVEIIKSAVQSIRKIKA